MGFIAGNVLNQAWMCEISHHKMFGVGISIIMKTYNLILEQNQAIDTRKEFIRALNNNYLKLRSL